MEQHLGRRIWTAGLMGAPFGVYKMGFGWYEFDHAHPVIGIAAMAWGAIDIGINLIAVLFPRVTAWCLLANLGRLIDRGIGKRIWETILLAVDTTASFAIVSVMIWFGRLPLEPLIAAHVWNLAVVCNVLSVGLDQLYRAIVGAAAKGIVPVTDTR